MPARPPDSERIVENALTEQSKWEQWTREGESVISTVIRIFKSFDKTKRREHRSFDGAELSHPRNLSA